MESLQNGLSNRLFCFGLVVAGEGDVLTGRRSGVGQSGECQHQYLSVPFGTVVH